MGSVEYSISGPEFGENGQVSKSKGEGIIQEIIIG
jgi:hypothetical protein